MPSATLKELAAKYMREKISSGEWGSGHRLSDFVLSKEIGISRTPIREAISQLVAEGLAEFKPHEGAFVRRMDKRELEELYEIREILECHCARKAAEAASPDLIGVLERSLDEMLELRKGLKAGQELLDAEATKVQRASDLRFHKALISAAGNARLEKIVGESHLHSQLFSMLRGRMRAASLQDAILYHGRLLDAVRSESPDKAEAAMREHMLRAKAVSLEDAAKAAELPDGSGESLPPALRKFV